MRVAQIERDARIVRDRQLAPPVRAEALRFLIHFVGGVHQPLHDADNGDRGGNNIRVIIGKRHSNMHAVWDVDVVRALGRNPDEVAARLEHEITPTEKQQWSGGPPPDWANEGHRLARDEIYARISGQGGSDGALILTQAYARQESSAAATQLEKAGVRLGAVLNQALR